MASSDDDAEVGPQFVTNYYFEDENGDPVSFSVLPIQFDDAEKPGDAKGQVFLHGTTDGGLQKVYKQVTAWKLGFQGDQPEISVLSKDNKWINLLKPRKIYVEETARTILITVHLLHFLRNKPESSEKSLWGHLHKVFSFENKASEDDIKDHHALIKQFIERDETLAKSQLLLMFLNERPRKRISIEDAESDPDGKKPFIANDDEMGEVMGDDGGNDSEEEPDLFDSVCAICDNGGDLLCCEGRCLRSFHATRSAGVDSDCKSLGFSRFQVEAIQNFLCKNCQYKQHQCFACGKLGSSDKSAGAEVFSCVNATCGHFYHPKCVAKLLYPDNEAEATEFQKKVAAGESFMCPVHKCIVCDKGENKEVKDLQFAMCRRCPKSYHRRCLPREIAFEDNEEEDIIQRAWDDLFPNRILIYCIDHEIDEDLGTPIRNHIRFPEIPDKKKIVDVQKSKVKVLVKKKIQDSVNISRKQTSLKTKMVTEKLSNAEGSHSLLKSGRTVSEQVLDSKKKVKPLKDSAQFESRRADGYIPVDNKTSIKEKAKTSVLAVPPSSAGKKSSSSFPVIDGETEKKIIALMGKVSSSLTLEYIVKKRTMPSTHAYSGRHIDKSITHGKVEGSVEAIRTALKKVEGGSSLEDAKAVCEPEILKNLARWDNKLKVYLSPFLHGVRYTSFGRHFTKVDKLIEIVDKLQWYAQDGDMIVDFCCGSNDFSQLMKEKLDAVGKKCLFKNYDVIQPKENKVYDVMKLVSIGDFLKNDFNFEKRDWMTVQPKELPNGSQLIMGLNPPFGLKAALANKFIDKALTFKPKLIILIVPPETERLDRKKARYDLVWEDFQKLSGKSFYLPGSVDVNDKQIEQWNNTPPVLYLWSHPNWTTKHKAIALKQGHASKEENGAPSAETPLQRPVDSLPVKENIKTEPRLPVKENVKTEPRLPVKENVKTEHRNGDAASEQKEARREVNNKAERRNKRSPENHRDKSRKIRKTETKEDVSEGRKVDESSEMSISPSDNTKDIRELSKGHATSEPFETPLERASNLSAFSRSGSELGTVRSATVLDEDIDDIAKRYITPLNREGSLNSSSYNRSGVGVGSLDYGIRSSEERFPTYPRDSNDPLGRKPYVSDFDAYGRSAELQPRLYGMPGQEERSRFAFNGPDLGLGQEYRYSSTSFGLPSSTTGPSAMERYAPRLDETNYSRAPGTPFAGGSSILGIPGMRDVPHDSMGFAPGPQHPYPRHGSSGWLND